METQGYSGRVRKAATIQSNDPKASSLTIVLDASIRPLIQINPPRVLLEGQPGQIVKASVDITAAKGRLLALEPVHFDLGEKVVYSIEEVKKGKSFRVHFSNVPDLSGISYGQLRLKTNYPEKPQITIMVRYKFEK